MSYERVKDEMRIILIAIAVISSELKHNYLFRKLTSLTPFYKILVQIFYGSWQIQRRQRRDRESKYYNRLKEYEKKGFIKKKKNVYVLTSKAKKIIGFNPKTENNYKYIFKNIKFDSRKYNHLKKRIDKRKFIGNYLIKVGIIKHIRADIFTHALISKKKHAVIGQHFLK